MLKQQEIGARNRTKTRKDVLATGLSQFKNNVRHCRLKKSVLRGDGVSAFHDCFSKEKIGRQGSGKSKKQREE